MVQLEDGLVARSQKGWPSVSFDVGRLVDFTHALWPAGFYNKTFKWPGWHTWEGMIRRSAGLGRPLTEPETKLQGQWQAFDYGSNNRLWKFRFDERRFS